VFGSVSSLLIIEHGSGDEEAEKFSGSFIDPFRAHCLERVLHIEPGHLCRLDPLKV
jgi:hypothetical protein